METLKCCKRFGPTPFLIPVPITGIQSDQVLGLKELFPRRRRGVALISVKSTEMRAERVRRLGAFHKP
ncbi:hypothetical protein CEJ86_15920 [Sinorhizobium meliloti]|uniref:Uncharacterized protein n=1 Tax=Rhizobium meliloti TaxID=382 RepID=A0A2J0Z1Y7_RHIML|nr:hypothetical protein CEJ86_15920 [Sinorhizobium meliloti]